MRKWAGAGALLLAALVAVALLYAQWAGTGRPQPAAPQAQGQQQEGTAGSPAGPTAEKPAEQEKAIPVPEPKRSPGPRAEFASPEATPGDQGAPPAAPPAARKKRAPTTAKRPADLDAGRSGTAPGPTVQVQPTAPQLGDYFRAVSAEIADRWSPPTPTRRDATIPVVLKIARDGRVLWALVEGSSGDPAIDESVAKMIEDIKREGLPPLPDQYPYDEVDIGLVLKPAGVS